MPNTVQTHIKNKDAYVDIRKKDYYLGEFDVPKKVTIFHVDINKQKSLINHLGLMLDEHIIISERVS